MTLDKLMSGSSLSLIYGVITFVGLFSTVYVMQMSHLSEIMKRPKSMQWMSRIGLALLAWGLLWSLGYAEQKDWEPWPPQLLVYFAIDVIMVSRAIALSAKGRAIRAEHERAQEYKPVR